MQDDIFVIDGVAHPLNLSPDNWADENLARPTNVLTAGILATAGPGYALDMDASQSEWQVDDIANMLFRESRTDVAIAHTLPVYFYKDGWCSWEKTVDAVTRYPDRFVGAYCAVDPLRPDPLGELERQAEVLQPIGVKLYPISYHDGGIEPWRMDDASVIFPIYEKAQELGIKHIAVHKAIPLGPTPGGAAFNPVDIEGAAIAFPDMTFEIVHGGMAFNEETAWLLGRFENVWVNMETLNAVLTRRPGAYGELLAGILNVGGEAAISRIFWSSGAMTAHPREGLEAFIEYQFSEELLERSGLFGAVPQLTHEHKRAILGGNLARLYGFDVDAMAERIKDDEFARDTANGLPEPYSTTSMKDAVLPADPAAV